MSDDGSVPNKITFWTLLYVLFTHPQDLKYGLFGIAAVVGVIVVGVLLYTGALTPADLNTLLDHAVKTVQGILHRG